MPLQHSITFDNEISLATAYIVISSITINYLQAKVTINVNIYKNSTAHSNGSPELVNYTHFCEGSNFITYFAESVLDDVNETLLTKAYDYLLSLPFYSGATEV